MKLINNKYDLFNLIQKVKQCDNTFITNCFIDQSKLNIWIEHNLFYSIECNEGVLLFRKDYNFFHIYYYVNSLDGLSKILSEHTQKGMFVVDLIGKTNDVESVSDVFSDLGYKLHATLEHYVRINKERSDNYLLSPEIETATEKYNMKITEMLYKHFDKYAEQVPSEQDVKNLIRDKKIIMIKNYDKIKGFLIRTILPQSSILNNFLVDPEFRNNKIGSKLLKHYIFESKNTRRMSLWVLKDNAKAINMYTNHGYLTDGLIDLIMILDNTNK